MNAEALFYAIAYCDAASVRRLLAVPAAQRDAWLQAVDFEGMAPLIVGGPPAGDCVDAAGFARNRRSRHRHWAAELPVRS